MTPESRNRQRLGKHIPAEANARSNRRAVFSVVCAASIATQRCGKHISAAVNQHATIEEAVFSVGAARTLHNEDYGPAGTRTEFRSWQLQQKIEGVSGFGSWQNNWEEMERKELGCAKKTSYRMCDLKWRWDCYESVARIRLVKSKDTSVCSSELQSAEISGRSVLLVNYELSV
jgi:hypothetical protein